MGDAGEGLIDADARIQERMEELERERARQIGAQDRRDPEKVHALESLRLARTELERQLERDDPRTAPRAARSRRSPKSTGASPKRTRPPSALDAPPDPPPLAQPFELLETIRWTPRDGWYLLDRHLARLEGSARHFQFGCSPAAIRTTLDQAVASARGPLRVRLLVAEDGAVRVEQTPLEIIRTADDAALRYRADRSGRCLSLP